MGLLPLGTAVDLKFSIVSFSILTTEGSLKARLLNSHGSAVMLKRQYDCEMVHGVWSFGQGCQMAKFDPFLSLDCARVEGVGAQSKERKGSNFAA